MPAPLPLPPASPYPASTCRGQSAAAIAQALQLCPRTVRRLLRRFRDQPQGCLALPIGQVPADPPTTTPSMLPLGLAATTSGTWGAGYIRVRLADSHPGHRPAQRTYPAMLVSPPATTPSPGPAADPKRTWAERPRSRNDTWQMDASEQLRLGSGQGISWLGGGWWTSTVAAFLGTTVFPPLPLGPRPDDRRAAVVAGSLRTLGLPRRLRVDNGKPWGSLSDLPSALALYGC